MRINLSPVKFAAVAATSFSANTPVAIPSKYREGRIVGIHVVASANVTCRVWFCKKIVDISTDTINESNISSWVTLPSNVVDPATLYHLGGDVKIDFDFEKYLQGNIPVIVENLGGVVSDFTVYLTLNV